MKNLLFLTALITSLVITSCSSKVTIEENERGVMFKRYDGGLQVEPVYPPGEYKVASSDRMFVYDISPKEQTETMEVLSADEQATKVQYTIVFHPKADEIGHIHYGIGEDYSERIVRPEVRSTIREEFERLTSSSFREINKSALSRKMQNDLTKIDENSSYQS